MADPLSFTLAAITLVTALKDVIELAQKLNESFKKPAHNMRAAESLAAETLEIVQDLKTFHAKNEKILEDATDLREAVITLLKDMKAVYEKCLPILETSHSSRTKFDKIKYSINSWRKGKVVERHIRDLKDQANRCYRRFTMSTQLDTAAGIVQLGSAMAQGFAHIQGQQYPLRVSNDNVLAFIGSESSPVILPNLPRHVKLSENLIYRLYITTQVGKIDGSFQTLAASESYPFEQPDSVHLRSFKSVIWLTPYAEKDKDEVHSHVFALIVMVQESLQSTGSGRDQSAIQSGAHAMRNLSVRLSNLQMSQEALTTAQYAVHLYRALAKTNQQVYAPHLAFALCRLSASFVQANDFVEAYKTITEAVTIGRRFAGEAPALEAKILLSRLICYSAHVARLNEDFENALQDAEEAVRGYQYILQDLSKSRGKSKAKDASTVDKKLARTVMGPGATFIYEYADALNELHHCLYPTTRKTESLAAGIKALEIYSTLDEEYRGSDVSNSIATLCASLTSARFYPIVPLSQALSYARRSVHHYEEILQSTGIIPAGLTVALVTEGSLLSRMENLDDAYAVWRKLENMLQDFIDDQGIRAKGLLCVAQNLSAMKRYSEAVATGNKVIMTYSSSLPQSLLVIAHDCTSDAYAKMGDHRRAIEVAGASVDRCRALSLQVGQSTKPLAHSISELARRLLGAEDYEHAFTVGLEAMKLYSSLITEDRNVLKSYTRTLQLNMFIAQGARLEMKSLERSRDVVQHCRELVNQFPDERNFFITLMQSHANLLKDFDRLSDGRVANEEVLRWFEDHPAHDSESANLHMYSLKASGASFREQGHINRESKYYEESVRIGQPFVDNSFYVARNTLWAKISKAQALHDVGKFSLAVDEIEDCLAVVAKYHLEKELAYTWCLIHASNIYRSSGKVDNALSIIRQHDLLHKDCRSSWVVSDVLADAGEEAQALTIAQKAVKETEKWKNSPITSEKSFHVVVQYSLALRLFAHDDLSQARDLLIQVRSFFEQHSQTRNHWFIQFAVTLWAEGVLECSSGRHEEGVAARAKLTDLQMRLRTVFPTLADCVEVGLLRERNFAAWRNILVKYKLACGHQSEVENPLPSSATSSVHTMHSVPA